MLAALIQNSGLTMLLLSLLLVALAPLINRIGGSASGFMSAMDGFVFVAIGGLVLGHVLPESMESAGWGALVVALLGMLGPMFVENRLHKAAKQVHTLTLILALIGVAAHAMADGVVLADTSDSGLSLAVVLHRLPEGLMVWWLLRPSYGVLVGWVALFAIAAATITGYLGASTLAAQVDPSWLGYLQALVAGSLLHVMVHRWHPVSDDANQWKLAAGLGALTGMALLLLLGETESGAHLSHAAHGTGSVMEGFIALALESAPALVFAYFASGLVHAYFPAAGVAWLGKGSSLSQSFRGVAFGLPLPMCSCGVIPVYRSLVLQGAPPTAAMAFFVATPELGLDAIFLSIPLLGPHLTAARVLCAIVVALVVGWLIGRMASNQPIQQVSPTSPSEEPPVSRFWEAIRVGFGDMVDATLPWIVLGLVIAAVLDPLLSDPSFPLRQVPPMFEVAVFGLIGMPAYVCASGATPLVAVLIAHGVSPGAAIAFLMTGPATNVTTFGVLKELHGDRIAIAFGAAIAFLSIAFGHLTNLLLPKSLVQATPIHEHSAGWFAWTALCALIFLGILSLLRQGPRGFVAKVVGADDDSHHGHSHDQEDEAPDEEPDCCH
ncbi:MAG TPA: hypothetical protein EYN06_00980 [Myxococcales bacterium]|nr:hypothetical protein [Myxococcales bacterium]HIN85023.1 hypothetical protein [Myxococcales bacterium]